MTHQKIQKIEGPTRSFMSEDVKHVLDQIDEILAIQRMVLSRILEAPPLITVDPTILSEQDIKDAMAKL